MKTLSFLLIVLGSAVSFAEERPPNIILIMVDDMGYGGLSCYDNLHYKTPEIDRLADEGLLLTDFHSNGASCSPTRAALMTGRYQFRSGCQVVTTPILSIRIMLVAWNKMNGLLPKR